MTRPKKYPDYNAVQVMKELLDEVSAFYLSEDRGQGGSIRKIAEEFDMTPLKLRKLLITAGVFSSEISEQINELKKEGKTILQIQELTGLSRASVHSYLPDTKPIYNAREISRNAARIKKYRQRTEAVNRLQEAMVKNETGPVLEKHLWDTLLLFEDYPFYTKEGLRFSYKMKGKEMCVSRKEMSITKSTIWLAFQSALELQQNGKISKQGKTFGADYLYAVFQRLGVND